MVRLCQYYGNLVFFLSDAVAFLMTNKEINNSSLLYNNDFSQMFQIFCKYNHKFQNFVEDFKQIRNKAFHNDEDHFITLDSYYNNKIQMFFNEYFEGVQLQEIKMELMKPIPIWPPKPYPV